MSRSAHLVSLEDEEVLEPALARRRDGVLALGRVDDDGRRALVVAVAHERPRVRLALDRDARPLELDDVDRGARDVVLQNERAHEVSRCSSTGVGAGDGATHIAGDEVGRKVEGERLGDEDVRRGLGEDVDRVPAAGRELSAVVLERLCGRERKATHF